ncbi:metallophosphoesterase family protein [Dellaglioa algida]|uniref:metallophosphoesterase family protein n=1 Tax=Dellaglioa algida TaxID=105612 RepID=UPI0024C4DC5F|nr:metallophosphoesterase family protein [Dellaglioa algida]MDK1727090.1 metallophosphoesterase family protein [Dellaglioa algida]
MIFFTSDTHFMHGKLLGNNDFAPRPFKDVNEMNQTIINSWNEIVTEDDLVYHLGDVVVLMANSGGNEAIFQILMQLNGRITFIKGNHDNRSIINYIKKQNILIKNKPKFEFHDVGILLKMNHHQLFLTHYPMMLGITNNSINLHGHIHHYSVNSETNINVGIDSPEVSYLENQKKFGAPFTMAEIDVMIAGKKEALKNQDEVD